MDAVFEEFKKWIYEEPILMMYNLDKPMELETDALNYAIGV